MLSVWLASQNSDITNINTLPYPGFPTDMQPQMTVTLALARGNQHCDREHF